MKLAQDHVQLQAFVLAALHPRDVQQDNLLYIAFNS